MGVFRALSSGPTKSLSKGAFGMSRGSSTTAVIVAPNPDPKVFKILRSHEHNGHSLIEVSYPSCTTFKGHKILLVKATKSTLSKLKVLDPHFLEEDGNVEVLARFRPTEHGWAMGMAMLKIVGGK